MNLRFQEKPIVLEPGAEISALSIESLRRDAAFPAALHDFLARTIAMYEANPLLNRILSDRGRTVVSLFALYLHNFPAPGEQESGLTMSRMQSLCRSTGLCSNGRAAALVSLLRFGGYLTPGVRDADHRRRVLVPTALFLREQRNRWRMQFEAMSPLFASARTTLGALDRPDFTAAFLGRLGERYFEGFRLNRCVPVLADLIESNAALLILADLILRAGLDRLPASGCPVGISTSAMARRFGVARAHVRNLLVEAERVGLIGRAHQDGHVIVLPPLAVAIESFFAAAFLLFAICGEAAISDIGLRGQDSPLRASTLR